MHWIPFDRISEPASRLHQICNGNAPNIRQWSVLPTLFLKYGIPGNRLLHRCRRILLGIPVDGMHFSSAGIHTGQSVDLDTDVWNDNPHPAFGTGFASIMVYKYWCLIRLDHMIRIQHLMKMIIKNR